MNVYYLSYKLQVQEEGKREIQEKEEISIPAITIPQPQEIVVYYEEETAEDSGLEGVFEEDPQTSVVSQKKEDAIESCSITSDGPVSFQDPGCDAEVEALLKVKYMKLVEYLSDCGPFEVDLGNQITERYKYHEALRSEDSFEKACEGIDNVRDYIDHKNELFEVPAFKQEPSHLILLCCLSLI